MENSQKLVDEKSVGGYMDAIGWSYNSLGKDIVVTGYRCNIVGYYYVLRIEIRISQEWVYIRSMLQRGLDPNHRKAVLRLVSRLNSECHRVKFLVVSDCVVIEAEIAQAQCHTESFVEGLYAVCRYGELAAVELGVVATNPAVATLYDQLNADAEARTSSIYAEILAEHDFELAVNTITDDQ